MRLRARARAPACGGRSAAAPNGTAGFMRISFSEGPTGCGAGQSNVGAACAGSPGSRRERALSTPRALGEELLHDAVFQRMEAHDRRAFRRASSIRSAAASARASSPSSSFTAMRRPWNVRVAGMNLPEARRIEALDEAGQLRRRRERLDLAVMDDRAGDAARKPLLAEMIENVGDLFFFAFVDDVGRAAARSSPCACRAGLRSGTKSRARPRRAAWRRRRCRARCRRARSKPAVARGGVEIAEARADAG